MITVTLNTATKDLPKLIKQTIENSEETVIATDEGAVVMIDEYEWNKMMEEIRTLKEKAAKARKEVEQQRKKAAKK